MENVLEINKESYPSVSQSFGLMGLTLLFSLLFAPVMYLSGILGKELATLLYYVTGFGSAFALFYTMRKRKTGISGINFSLGNFWIIPLAVLGVLGLGFGLSDPIISLIPMPDFVKQAFQGMLGNPEIFTFLAVVVAAPILEELIFRGIILDGLLKRYSPLKSILISSLLFGIVHLNPWQFIGAMFFGMFSGWVYYKTKSVLPSIIMHAVNNLVGFLSILIYGKESMDSSLAMQMGGMTNAILVIVGAIVVLLGSIYFLRKEFAKEESPSMVQPSVLTE